MSYLRNRVGNTTTTVGTGAYTLGAALDGLRSILSAFDEGEIGTFVVEDGVDWEVVVGTRVGDTITRDSIEDSSNNGAAVEWGPGTRNILCTATARRMVTFSAPPPDGDAGRLLALDGHGHVVPVCRDLMASVSGTVNALVLTTVPAVTSWLDGDRLTMVASGDNTDVVTAAVNGAGGASVKKESRGGLVDLAAGDIQSEGVHTLVRRGAVWVLEDPDVAAVDLAPYVAKSANLSDLASVPAARGNLGVMSAPEVSTAIAAAVAAVSGIDQTARDQIALTNLRQLLSTSVSSGALVGGRQWELSTDEWGATSTGAVWVSGPPGYYTNYVGGGEAKNAGPWVTSNNGGNTIVDRTVTLTNGKTVTHLQVYSVNAQSGTAYVVKRNSAGNYTVVASVAYSHSGGSIWQAYALGTPYAIPASGEYYPAAYSATANPATQTTSATNARAYVGGAAAGTFVATEDSNIIVGPCGAVYQSVSGNMTLIPPSNISLSSGPSYADTYFLWKDDSLTTNLLTWSALSGGGWTLTALTSAVTSSIADPVGGAATVRLTEGSSTGYHYVAQSVVKPATAANYVGSIHVHASSSRSLYFGLDDGTGYGVYAVFNPAAGVFSSPPGLVGSNGWSGPTGGVAPCGNGWYRVWIGATSNAATTVRLIAFTSSGAATSYAGDGVSGAYVWGAQVEQAAVLGGYVPTTTAAATGPAAIIGQDCICEMSRISGTTWTTATLTVIAAYDGSYTLIRARANLGSQPAGTSLTGRIKAINSKVQRIAAPAIYVE